MLPFVREAYPFFWTSLTIRPLTVFTALIFITLSLPLLFMQRELKASCWVLALIGLFLTFSGLSTWASAIPWQGTARWLEIGTYAIAGVFLYHQIHDARGFRHVFSLSLILTLFLIILRFLYFWVSAYDPTHHSWSHQPPLAENIRHIGYLAALLLPVAFTYLPSGRKEHPARYPAVLLYLCAGWGLVFWMGGRATFLALIVTSVLFIWFHPRTAIPMIATCIMGLLLSQLFITTDPSLNLIRLFNYDLGEKTINQISSNRGSIYEHALRLWWQKAPVIGLGADAFRYLQPAILADYLAQPHSVVVQVLLSFGLVGGVLITSLLLLLLKHSWQQLHVSPWPGLTCAGIAALLTGLVDGVFYHSLAFFLTSIVLALALPETSHRIRFSNAIAAAPVLFAGSSILFYVFLSWQIHLSRQTVPPEHQLATLQKYPAYVEPSLWIRHAHANNSRLTEDLARLAVTTTDRSCRFFTYLPPAEQDDFRWCIQNEPPPKMRRLKPLEERSREPIQ